MINLNLVILMCFGKLGKKFDVIYGVLVYVYVKK